MATRISPLKLSQALIGFINHQTAAGLSDSTLIEYRYNFKKLQLFFTNNPNIGGIGRPEMVAYFAWLRNDYVSVPDGVAPRGRIAKTRGQDTPLIFIRFRPCGVGRLRRAMRKKTWC